VHIKVETMTMTIRTAREMEIKKEQGGLERMKMAEILFVAVANHT